jgi:hypothetical protein
MPHIGVFLPTWRDIFTPKRQCQIMRNIFFLSVNFSPFLRLARQSLEGKIGVEMCRRRSSGHGVKNRKWVGLSPSFGTLSARSRSPQCSGSAAVDVKRRDQQSAADCDFGLAEFNIRAS